MDISEQELFDSATNGEPVERTAEAVETTNDVTRDDKGRFAEKAEAEPVKTTTEPAAAEKVEAHVPSWRLREERERAEAAERRLNELQARLPKPETPAAPDVFENPNGFLEHGVRQAIDPVKQEIGNIREYYSRKGAEQEHGKDKVEEAFSALSEAFKGGDAEARAVAFRANASMDPYGEIVSWHQKQAITRDPNKWFEQELERRSKEDPAFFDKFKPAQTNPDIPQKQAGTVVRLPPSLNKAAAAAAPSSTGAEMSDAELFERATSGGR